jgi:hypothetical protein
MTERRGSPNHDRAERYAIRVQGHLDSRWAAWFDGLSLAPEADGTTVIHGEIADQSALHGVLQRLRDIGLELVSVSRLERQQSAITTTDPTTPTGDVP